MHRTAVPVHEHHQMAQCEVKILLLFKGALGETDKRGENSCKENVKTEFYLGK